MALHRATDKNNAAPNKGLAEALRSMLLEKIEAGKLVLPAMPATAARVIEAIDAGAHQGKAATLLESDPVLLLEVLRLANSASAAPRGRIDNVGQAVMMLGEAKLRSVLLSAVARQVFVSRSRAIRETMTKLWTHSVAVAAVARQIAVHVGLEDREVPYLGGLMHDIGKPVVAIHLLELERSITRAKQAEWIDPAQWLAIVQELHRPVGIAVAKHWNMSTQVCKAVEDCVEFDPVERASASNAVRFANALAKREGVYAGAVDAETTETVLVIGRSMLGLDDDAVASLMQALRATAASSTESSES
jgi:putative nucleotidyltransferase with HDIG domain